MRIIHISDIHLSSGYNPINRTQRLLESMTETLKSINSERSIDLIIFSGDMLNQGGKTFENIESGFKTFELTFLNRMLTELNLPKSAFLFVPGNHDVNRSLDNQFVEAGLKDQLVNQDKLDEYYSLPPYEGGGMKRVYPFKQFEKAYYESCSDIEYIHSPFQSTIITTVGTVKVGVTLLNSVWRCWDSSKDKGNILMSIRQINDSHQLIKDCQVKIAVSHHDISWMNEFETLALEKSLTRNYDMFFCGHTHSLNTEYCIKPEGSMFRLTAPGILSANTYAGEKQYINGFSVIDFDTTVGCLETQIFRQDEDMTFYMDKNHGTDGIWHIEIPAGQAMQHQRNMQDIILGIKEEVDTLNQNLLSYKTPTTAPKALNQIFVLPRLNIKRAAVNNDFSVKGYEDECITDLSYFVNSKENFIIFGIKESGKTILLDKLLLEFLSIGSSKRVIPALINFGSITNDIGQSIQMYWHQKRGVATSILQTNEVVLLIDNIDFAQETKMEVLTSFLAQHPNVRFIGTCLERHQNDLVLDSYDYVDLDYHRVEINQFGTKEIKNLVTKWMSGSNHQGTSARQVEFLVEAFSSLNLPRTPFAVSMFLWIIERQESFKPQNDALLIKCFLEELLKSKDPKGAPREHFDYLNKISLLAVIAKQMYEHDELNYSLPESGVLKIIEDELASYRFSFYRGRDILKEFLDLSIFVEEDNQRIRFRFSCFFEYFLYEYMRQHKDFFEYVMDEKRYLSFCNEINYFTGINRGAAELVNVIMERLEYDYIEINNIVFNSVHNIDDFFNVQTSLLQQITAEDLIRVLPDKETEEDKEIQLDQKLQQADSEDPEVIRKKNNNKFLNYSRLLLLAMNVLKNAEEIKPIEGKDNSTKKYYYELVLKNSISYAILYRLICLEMFRHQEHFPKSRIEELKVMVHLLPILHEELIRNHMGTYKLSDVIFEKIQSDKQIIGDTISEFERFLSVFLYADLKAKSYMDIIQEFLKSFRRTYIADASYLKLISYYYTSTDKQLDQRIINWISDLYIKVHNPKSGKVISKSHVLQQLKRGKELHEVEKKKEASEQITDNRSK